MTTPPRCLKTCAGRVSGAQRYWESNVELDLVAPDPDDAERLLVAEVKWRRLTAAERKNVLRQLESKWSHCSLSARHPQGPLRGLRRQYPCRVTVPLNIRT